MALRTLLAALIVAASLLVGPATTRPAAAAPSAASVGPGLPPPAYVGRGQAGGFQFTTRARAIPGVSRLYLRPLVEGATWMEDFGVFWLVTVLNPDGTAPPPPPAVYSPTGAATIDVPTPRGTFTTHLIKERLSDVSVRTVTANSSDCFDQCPAKPLAQYAA